MAAHPCGCESSPDPPYIRYCARHDPARVRALEQLCHDVLERAQAVASKLDSAVGNLSPLLTKTIAADAMQDLLEEFAPQYRKLMNLGSPLPSSQSPLPTEQRS